MIDEETRHRLHQIQGLITLDESDRLAALAAEVPAWSTIVEIGTHTGRSTCWLVAGARSGNGAHVVVVDPWPEPGYTAHYEDCKSDDDPFEFVTGQAVFEKFVENFTAEQAWPYATVLRARSLEVASMWVNPLGLLFVDALHGYADVKADAEVWLPHVMVGGIAAFHDWYDDPDLTHESQVADAVHDTIDPGDWDTLEMTDALWVARKR